MAKYQIVYIDSGGGEVYDDDIFDTEAEAEEAGRYGCSCYALGNEICYMSNPWDNPLDECGIHYRVVEVEE